jgi:hypothetical protein
MFQITVNPKVLKALQTAFPKPANSAEKALAKYVRMLEDQLFKALHSNREPEDRKLDLYVIALREFSQKGPCLGPKKTRLHSWLNDNKLALVEAVKLGSNLTGQLSRVKLSKLIEIHDIAQRPALLISSTMTSDELDEVLTGTKADNQDLFARLYPDYYLYATDKQRLEVFDVLPVDIQSLKNFIVWLVEDADRFSQKDKALYLRQARTILGVALHTKGLYFQRKKPSEFGRMYYEGISIQSVHKELRRAILGDCWMYDVRSSVIAWKMQFANEYMAIMGIEEDFHRAFSASLLYLEDKRDFMATVIYETFDSSTKVPKELQPDLVKQGLTAIGFGAGLKSKGWKSRDGTWALPSMAEIFWNKNDRDRFVNNLTVKKFQQEQQALDNYLFSNAIAARPKFFASEMFKATKKPSKSKVVAYLYQQSETKVMDVARSVLKQDKRPVIANIHDAIIIRKKLSADMKHEVELQMQEQTGNKYWRLAASHLEPYRTVKAE